MLGLGSLIFMNALGGAAVAIDRDLPAGFLGMSTGLAARDDFLFGFGTALSPPLWFVMLFTLAMLLSTREDRWRRRAIAVLAVAGAIVFVGQLGEPITYTVLSSGGFDGPAAAVVLANLVLGPALAIIGARRVRRHE